MYETVGAKGMQANKQQQGSVLLISLGLLVVLTLMTFTISNSVLLQEKMTTSNRDDALAMQIAESALRDAELLANTFAEAEYTLQGNQGLYLGMCDYADADCYLNSLAEGDMFDDAYWDNTKSRAATTEIACSHGTACPLKNPDRYQAGRYKLILLDNNFDVSISGADKATMIDNQYQSRDEGANPIYYLYKVIATGQGIDDKNRRVVVSHFAAPAP